MLFRSIKHLDDKSLAVRENIALLLHSISIAAPDFMNGNLLGIVLPKMLSTFKESTATVKILFLKSIRRLIRLSFTFDYYLPYLTQLVDVFKIGIADDYYKLPAESLKTAGSLVKLLSEASIPDATDCIKKIYTMTNDVFKLPDIDADIKNSSIFAMGNILSHASSILTNEEIDNILGILQERLKNENKIGRASCRERVSPPV